MAYRRALPLLAAGRLLTLLSTGFVLASCGTTRGPLHLILAGDASASNAGNALPSVDAMRASVEGLVAPGDRLTVFRFASETQEVASKVPTDSQEFSDRMTEFFQNPSPDEGTSFSRVLGAIAESVDRSPLPTVAALYTDGANDDPDPQAAARIGDSAARLAKSRQLVRLEVLGAKPGQREWLRKALAPLGERLAFGEVAPVDLSLPQSQEAGK